MCSLPPAHSGFECFYLDFVPVMTLFWIWQKWGHLQIFPPDQRACKRGMGRVLDEVDIGEGGTGAETGPGDLLAWLGCS